MTANGRTVLLPFREARTYVHGTTLFTLLTDGLGAVTDISLKIARVIRSNRLLVHEFDSPERCPRDAAATLFWNVDGALRGRAVTEQAFEEPVQRDSYDEDGIGRLAAVSNGTASIPAWENQRFIEVAVACNKRLLRSEPIGKPTDQFVFTRLDVSRVPASDEPLEIRFERSIAEKHFLSSIFAGDAKLGAIYFSKVTAA